jgi:hypothetical protein
MTTRRKRRGAYDMVDEDNAVGPIATGMTRIMRSTAFHHPVDTVVIA